MSKVKVIKLETEHFTLYELAEGVYAAIEKENNTGSNAGIIDLGDSTVIFDTFLNIDAAKELKQAGEQLTGRSASYVINSHSHTDHIIGNCLFPGGTAIISTSAVRDEIQKSREEYLSEKETYASRIKEIEASLNTNADAVNEKDLKNELQFLRSLVKSGVDICMPGMTSDSELTLYGSKRVLKLKTFDIAHSSGDMVAYLPEDKICFMGDLLSNHGHAWLGSGNPEQFIKALQNILTYDINEFVPGHGALSSRTDVSYQIQYIEEMLELVERKGSTNPEDYSVDDLSPIFRDWRSLCFSWNINFLIERMKPH